MAGFLDKYQDYLTQSTAPAIGVAGGIIGGTVLVNAIVDKGLKLSGTAAMATKIATRIGIGGLLFSYGKTAATSMQLVTKSAGIGMFAGIVLDFAKRYGFASGLEKALGASSEGTFDAVPEDNYVELNEPEGFSMIERSPTGEVEAEPIVEAADNSFQREEPPKVVR